MAVAVLNYPVKDINYIHFSGTILFAQYRFFYFYAHDSLKIVLLTPLTYSSKLSY